MKMSNIQKRTKANIISRKCDRDVIAGSSTEEVMWGWGGGVKKVETQK